MMIKRPYDHKGEKEDPSEKGRDPFLSKGRRSHPDKRRSYAKDKQERDIKRQSLWILALIVLYATIVSFLLYEEQKESPFSRHPVTDEEAYVTQAKGILEGSYPGKKIFYQSPLYPYFLAGTFYFFGENYNAVRIIQLLFGLMSIILIYFLGRFLFDARIGLIAAALLALYGPIFNYQILLLKVSPFLILLALFLLTGSFLAQQPESWWCWFLLGIFTSFLLLLRDNAQIFLGVIPLWILFQFRDRSWKWRGGIISLFILGAAIILAPLIVRNKMVAGEWVLSTSQGGANFFIGNNPIADGRYKTLPFVRPHPETEQQDFKAEAEKRVGRPLQDTEISGFWYRQGLLFIRHHPAQWFRLLWKKIRFFFGNFEIPDNHGYTFDRSHLLPALYLAPLSFGIIFPLALFGMITTRHHWHSLSFLYLFFIFYSLSILAFYVVGRYRVPIVLPLLPFAAAGLNELWKRFRNRNIPSLLSALVLILATSFFSYFPTEASQASWATEYFLLGNAYLKDADDSFSRGNEEKGKVFAETAVRHFKRSLELNPRNDNAKKSLKYAYKLLGLKLSPDIEAGSAIKEPPLSPPFLKPGSIKAEELTDPLLKARAYTLERRYEEALKILKEASRKDPQNAQWHFELGLLLASRKPIRDFQQATFHLKRALEIDPKFADAWNVLGNIAYINGNMKEARSHYLKALTLVPDSPAYKNNLALTYQPKLKNLEESRSP